MVKSGDGWRIIRWWVVWEIGIQLIMVMERKWKVRETTKWGEYLVKNSSCNYSQLFLDDSLGHKESNFDSIKCMTKMGLKATQLVDDRSKFPSYDIDLFLFQREENWGDQIFD